MFICELDPAFAFGVILFEHPFDERDYFQYVETIPKLDKRVADRETPTLLLELAEGYPPPDAVWRKRFVEARARLVSKPVVAIVAPGVAMRAGVRLGRWIRPPPFEQKVFATVEEAFEWLEQRRGPMTKVLRRLYGEAKQRVD